MRASVVRISHRQRLEEQRVHDAEDRHVAADGERERDDGGHRKGLAAHQQAQAVKDVLTELAGEAKEAATLFGLPIDPENRFARAIDVAELTERPCPGGLGVEALRLQGGCFHLEVKAQLLPHVVSHVRDGSGGESEEPAKTSGFHRDLRPDRGL